MHLHITTGRWRYGLGLTILTVCLWGLLPLALKGVLTGMDAFTITWYRFLFSALLLALFIFRRHGLSAPFKLRGLAMTLLCITALGLCSNYILYLIGLSYVSPSTATVVIQLAPMFLLFGSLFFFKERLATWQWFGFCTLLFGLGLFFNQRYGELFGGMNGLTAGVLFIVVAGVVWAAYALAQKQLLDVLPSSSIMFVVYLTGAVLFLPLARPATLLDLDTAQLLFLVFCALNTLIAYGSFAEALNHLEASRVSMILATTPLLTVCAMAVIAPLIPELIEPESLNGLSIFGALLVVAGSMLAAVGRRNKRRKD